MKINNQPLTEISLFTIHELKVRICTSSVFHGLLESVFADPSGNSVVYYKGTPTTTHFETSGNLKIVRE